MDPFPSHALDANRRGELLASQRVELDRPLRRRNRRATLIAAVLFAAAVVGGLMAPAALPPVWRIALVGVPLGIAITLLLRIVTGADRALGRDLHRGRVESLAGSLSKEQTSAMDVSGTSVYFLRVADQSFIVEREAYEAAPDSGEGRVYYLPAARKVINLERLAITDASPVTQPRPLHEALVGSWRNHLAQATFTADGRVTASVMGRSSAGAWSVDPQGRLHAQIAGRDEVAQASVSGNELRISLSGRVVTLTRER